MIPVNKLNTKAHYPMKWQLIQRSSDSILKSCKTSENSNLHSPRKRWGDAADFGAVVTSEHQTHTQLMPVLTSSPYVGQPQKSNIYNNLNVTTTEMITLFSLLSIKHPLHLSCSSQDSILQDLKKCTKL